MQTPEIMSGIYFSQAAQLKRSYQHFFLFFIFNITLEKCQKHNLVI